MPPRSAGMSSLWKLAVLPPRRTEVLMPGETMTRMFWNGAQARAGQVWLREKTLGIWRAWTWHDAAVAVREIAMGLAAVGVQPGERVSILGNTVLEWLLADLAVLSAGGVSNGIYPT